MNPSKAFSTARKDFTYLIIAGLAFLSALNYQLFVFPNNFAPAGLNGLCTMIQYVMHIKVSFMNIAINVPLAILIFFLVSKVIATRSMVFVLTFSGSLLLLDYVDISFLAYETANGTSTILGPLVAGVINGAIYSILVQSCAYTGGTDFVACLMRKNRPQLNFFWIVFAMNALVAILSFFVYDYQIEPVLLCIMYSFMSSTVSDRIITDHPEELSHDIITKLHHSATVVPAKGRYSGRETNILVCIINKAQISNLAALIHRYPNTFAVMSSVNEVMGNFKHLNTEGKENNNILDTGDVSAV